MFLPDIYVIVFNNEWLRNAKMEEVIICSIHETRHGYQKACIDYNDIAEQEDPFLVSMWEKDFKNYVKPSSFTNESYIMQEIEIDAIAFSHYAMNKVFNINTFIPKNIKEKVYEKIIKILLLHILKLSSCFNLRII